MVNISSGDNQGMLRVLIADDSPAVIADYRKIFENDLHEGSAISDFESRMFGELSARSVDDEPFEVDYVEQGQEALEAVLKALDADRPYSVAFIDCRMPPGWDGVETVRQLWNADDRLEIVLCTAFADYSVKEILNELGNTDHLLILKKPFEECEVIRMAQALLKKWNLARVAGMRLEELEASVQAKTMQLETQNKELEAALKEVRTAQHSLVHSEKMASIGSLANAFASSFCNPIAYVSSNLETLQEYLAKIKCVIPQAGSEESKIYFQHAKEALGDSLKGCDQLLLLLEELGEFSKANDGVKSMSDVNLLLEQAIAIVRTDCENHVSFSQKLGDLPRCACYRDELKDVFLKVLLYQTRQCDGFSVIEVNSRYIDSSFIEVHFRCQVLRLSDKEINELFEPFSGWIEEEGNRTNRVSLFVVKNIMEHHGGSVSVKRLSGGGIGFELLLPLAKL